MFNNDLQNYIFLEKYSRWDYNKDRRETFEEAVDRSIAHAHFMVGDKIHPSVYEELREGMMTMEAFPSLRFFQTAGEEATRHPQSIFNCSYLPVIDHRAFSETLLLLGLGVGVGYSVEKKYVKQLPEILSYRDWSGHREIVIEDSLEGWAHSLNQAFYYWFSGIDPTFNFSKLRPKGSPLKTRGGYSSGPEPFEEALEKIREIMGRGAGRKLEPIEVHDIQCHIASAIVSGGFRRSAMISLFDIRDKDMFGSKMGTWYEDNPQRRYANNSFVLEKEYGERWWESKVREIFDGGYGEPGIFSRLAADSGRPKGRKTAEWGTNPCGEVVLRPFQFCNLSIANIRAEDNYDTIARKTRLATIWGTIQATADHFPGNRREWGINQVEERLLGVDLNGQRDNEFFHSAESVKGFDFEGLNDLVKSVNAEYANLFGIRPGAALTSAKPAGNSSVLFDTASGIHPRHAEFYIRRVQVLQTSPMAAFLASRGVPFVELTQDTKNTLVFDFPVESPLADAPFKGELSAIEQLEYWKQIKTRWTDHNPSVTIDYLEGEKMDIARWLSDNQKIIGGLSFFPYTDVKYDNAPYETIDEETYNELASALFIDWEEYWNYDKEYFNPTREFACVGGACDIQL